MLQAAKEVNRKEDEKKDEIPTPTTEPQQESTPTTGGLEVVELETETENPKGVVVQVQKLTHNKPHTSSPVWNAFVRIKGQKEFKDYAVCRKCDALRKCDGGC